MELLLGIVLFFQNPSMPQDLILGVWHGTSICVDKKVDTGCKDEVVVYEVDTVGVRDHANVMVHAFKIVNGERVSMGDLEFRNDREAHVWRSDVTTRRGEIQFRFTIAGKEMKGTLVELPSERVIRKIEMKR